MPLFRFLANFERAATDELETPPYTLILGAGASCSAGIPLTYKMVELLHELVAFYRFPLEPKDPGENDLAWLLSTLAEYGDPSLPYDFLLKCIRRAEHEPNIAHLVAAALACAGIVRTIITTNFDDLALAAFWSLPQLQPDHYQEPFVLYDPEAVNVTSISLGEEVPIVIKAHGHHTQYGLGVANQYVKRLAPHVCEAIRWSKLPRLGYIVVGYSGTWDDGVMEALIDPQVTGRLNIYWFYREEFPENVQSPLKELLEARLVYTIRCDDADFLFLNLLHRGQPLSGLTVRDLVAEYGPSAGRLYKPDPFLKDELRTKGWWRPYDVDRALAELDMGKAYTRALNIEGVRSVLVPLLCAIERWDHGDQLRYDCFPTGTTPYEESEERIRLEREIGGWPFFRWTRRNLKLLQLALDKKLDGYLAFGILDKLDSAIRTRVVLAEPHDEA